MKHDEFIALIARLGRASEVLRAESCLLQAIARRYYLFFAIAVQAAQRHGLAFRRGAEDDDRRLTHQALPNLVRALYSGQNSGAVLGGGPGVVRTGRLAENLAYRYANILQKDRKYADYGYGTVPEPYDVTTADEHLAWANHLIEDLKTLL